MDRDRVLPIGTVIFLLIAVGGTLWQRSPLRSVRPPVSAGPETHVFQAENVNARLWQDPVGAVELAWEKRLAELQRTNVTSLALHERKLPRVNRLENVGAEIAARGDSATVVILPVIMTEGYHSVAVESRRRERQAVVRGLAVESCASESDKRIGFFGTVWTRADRSLAQPELASPDDCARPFSYASAEVDSTADRVESATFAVPFEWFRQAPGSTAGGTKYVLVLWIAEDKLAAGPVEMIAKLVGRLRGRFRDVGVATTDPVPVIGPATSGGLQKILLARQEGVTVTDRHILEPCLPKTLFFVSSRATAPRDLLIDEDSPAVKEPGNLTIEIRRTIANDRTALTLLAEELQRRIPDYASNPRVAMFGEWDSQYGRAMIDIFIDVGGVDPLTFSLLRGIDGSTPHTPDADPGQTMLTEDENPPGGFGSVGPLIAGQRPVRTMPFGRAQLDAFRRQADQLSSDVEAAGGELVAVGVLGADIFDKLLVIQAMRERYPSVMLFTTDLDAMFLHPSLNRWCRNLLVASGHDLVPHGFGAVGAADSDLEVRFPPFRDNYQTSTFLATRLALSNAGLGQFDRFPLEPTSPRIFEVGRERAYDLTPTSAGMEGVTPNYHRPDGRNLLILGIILVLMTALIAPIIGDRPLTRARASRRKRRRAAVAAVVMVGFGLVLVPLYLPSADTGEPFYLAAGISVWPSLLLRILAIAVAVYALLRLPENEMATRRTIHKKFGLAAPGPDDAETGCRAAWRAAARGLMAVAPGRSWNSKLLEQERPAIGDVWHGFVASDRAACRRARVVLGTVLAVGLNLFMFKLIPMPLAPARGAYAQWFNFGSAVVAGILFYWLFFTALDGMRRHRLLLELMDTQLVAWTPAERTKIRREVGLPKDAYADLADRVRGVEFVATVTEPLNRKLVMPFMVLLLLLLGRLDIFDNWGMPQMTYIFLLYSCAVVLGGGVIVYRLARRLRGRTLGEIATARNRLEVKRDEIFAGEPMAARATGGGRDVLGGDADTAECVAQARRLRRQLHGLGRLEERVTDQRSGVFRGWVHHPLVRAGVLAGLVAATFLEQILRIL